MDLSFDNPTFSTLSKLSQTSPTYEYSTISATCVLNSEKEEFMVALRNEIHVFEVCSQDKIYSYYINNEKELIKSSCFTKLEFPTFFCGGYLGNIYMF